MEVHLPVSWFGSKRFLYRNDVYLGWSFISASHLEHSHGRHPLCYSTGGCGFSTPGRSRGGDPYSFYTQECEQTLTSNTASLSVARFVA